jgi:hypothetical protein
MRRATALSALLWLAAPAAAQQVVDRIAARIEDDVITASEVQELGRYQQLVQGHAAPEADRLSQLIDQWIVRNDAAANGFAAPAEPQITGELERLEKQSSSPAAFRARLAELDLTEAVVRSLLSRQIHLTRYLDYKFRPMAQVGRREVQQYYRDEFAPQLRGRSQPVPPLENVAEQIRELLTERDINERAARWLDETRSRLRIETAAPGGAP